MPYSFGSWRDVAGGFCLEGGLPRGSLDRQGLSDSEGFQPGSRQGEGQGSEDLSKWPGQLGKGRLPDVRAEDGMQEAIFPTHTRPLASASPGVTPRLCDCPKEPPEVLSCSPPSPTG